MAQTWNPGRGTIPEQKRGSISSEIHVSRDQTRNQIIEYIQNYLELENVDLTKSSFLSFIIDIVSTLTSNLMFYQISSYREFFLTKALLPESILNLSSFLGYNTQEASYSSAELLVTIPLGFPDANTSFIIPVGHQFLAGDILFKNIGLITFTITNNSVVKVTSQEGNTISTITNVIDTDANSFSFILPVQQVEEVEQEFQIDTDLQLYQFTQVDVPLDGKVSDIDIEVRGPNESSWRTYTEFNSLYLMSETDYGFVSRRTDNGRRIYFGNGIIGVQPEAGSTVKVTASITKGAEGNVIAGSITKTDRLYNVTDAGVTQVVNIFVTNTSPAVNGEDEESLEEIRRNSIDNLASLGRLVSELDYIKTDVVIPDSPIAANAIPVLKRSDVRVNDIQLFTTILFGTDVVPTRNALKSYPIGTTYIPRASIITLDGTDYQTLFDMTIDTINGSAYYSYIMYEIAQTPTLVTTYGITYNVTSDNLIITKSGSQATFELQYFSDESDFDILTCEMEISETGVTYDMVNDATSQVFTYTFSDYNLIPEDENTYYFTISRAGNPISQYSSDIIFRQQLNDFMLSTVVSDSTSMIVYDIPVVQKEYYDGIDQRSFELLTLQQMMKSIDFSDYKMLTDFANIKFSNTTGVLRVMLRNKVTRQSVIDLVSVLPSYPDVGDRYIKEMRPESPDAYDNYIVECTDATNVTWFYRRPFTDDIVEVENKGTKYIYTEFGWKVPEYNIPLEIELEVFKRSNYSGALSDLVSLIKSTLIETFKDRFGSNAVIYRSEIIEAVQGVEGVERCRLFKPESSIFFDFNIDNFDQDELLEYSPDYVYFTEDEITIRIL